MDCVDPNGDAPLAPSAAPEGHSRGEAVSRVAAVALRLVGIGCGIGLLVELLAFPDTRAFVTANAMDTAWRGVSLASIGLSVSLLLATAVVYSMFRPQQEAVEKLNTVARLMSPLGWLWPLPLYFDPTVFGGVGLLRVVLAVVWGVALEHSLRTSFSACAAWGAPLRWRKAFSQWAPVVGAAVAFGLIFWFIQFCARYTVLQHKLFSTHGFDLGLFDNLMFNLMHGEWFRATVDRGGVGGNHLQYHANFLAYLFVPFYALSPRAETLLIIQAFIVGMAGCPFYLLAKHKLESAVAGVLFCFLFLVHEGVQSPVFFDFHDLTLAPLFVGCTLYFFETNRRFLLLLSWCLAVLLREDQGAVLGAAALVYLLSGKRPIWALFGGILGVAWLALMRLYVMPMNGADHSFHQHIGIFEAMVAPGTSGFGGVLKTIATNPPFTLNNFLEARKVEYVLALGAPFLLIPFRKARLLLLFVPAALFTLVSTNYAPAVSTRFQYSMYWIPMLLLGTLLVFDDWKKLSDGRARIHAAMVAMFVVATALSYGGAGLLGRHPFTGGFTQIKYEFSPADALRLATFRGLIADIPKSASVTASELIVPHVSNRRDVFTLRQGVGDPDYLVLMDDEIHPGGQGDELLVGARTGKWGVIRQAMGFQVWKRGASTADNAAALARVGLQL